MNKTQNALPQRYSRMSNLKTETENGLPQRHSRMSILNFGDIAPAECSEKVMFVVQIKNIAGCFGRLSGLLCRSPSGGPYCPSCPLVFKTTPAQRGSGISILGVGVLGILRILGVLGWKTKTENSPYSPYRPLDFKTTPAQPDSGDNMRGDLPPVVYNIWSAQSTKY